MTLTEAITKVMPVTHAKAPSSLGGAELEAFQRSPVAHHGEIDFEEALF